MEACFIFQLIIIARAGYIEIGWKLMRSAQCFTQNPNLASEWPKAAFSKIEKIVAWVIAVNKFCYFQLFSAKCLLFVCYFLLFWKRKASISFFLIMGKTKA